VDQLFPAFLADVNPVELVAADFRPTPADRPWVVVNMVASIDGAIEVDGRSGGLGSPPDKAMFHALRQLPDVILAGAGTVRAENYGPVQLDADAQARRVERGQRALPRLAVVSGRAHLDPASRLFSDPMQRPLIITTSSAPSDHVDKLRDVADIIVAGSGSVDMHEAFAQLRSQELKTLLCEGGPTLNNQLLAENLVDEWCQTIAPVLTGGDATRGASGPTSGVSRSLQLARIIVEDDVMLLRYARES
jgi:riboflavin-specific deaminase-like protein